MTTKTTIVHISDLHYREHWEEEQGLVLERFFEDLGRQLGGVDRSKAFVAFSGEVVRAGGHPGLYGAMAEQFDMELSRLRLPRDQRICVPGNHDVSVDVVRSKRVEHQGVIQQELDEKRFNDYVGDADCLLMKKFANYREFERGFAKFGVSNSLSGAGWTIASGIDVYCMNSALCSSGGLDGISDKGALLSTLAHYTRGSKDPRHRPGYC